MKNNILLNSRKSSFLLEFMICWRLWTPIFHIFSDSTQSTGLAAIKMTALGRPNLLVSPEGWWEWELNEKIRKKTDGKNDESAGFANKV